FIYRLSRQRTRGAARVELGRLRADHRRHGGELSPQLAAFFTSATILASSAAVNSFSAKDVGHMAPSSRFALSLKPNVAYLDLNFCALWKKQTTLPSLAYEGIPYQVFGERVGALALMIAWSRSPITRSGSCISAIFSSTALSPSALPPPGPRRASVFSSWARSRIASRSSAVNPLDALPVVLLADFCVPFFVGFLSAIAKYLLVSNESAELPGRHVRAEGGRRGVRRLRVLPVDPAEDAAQPREVADVLHRGGPADHLRDRAMSRRGSGSEDRVALLRDVHPAAVQLRAGRASPNPARIHGRSIRPHVTPLLPRSP